MCMNQGYESEVQTMKKADILALANKGAQEINGIKVEVTTHKIEGFTGETLNIKLLPVNEYSTPAFFGGGFHEYYTDEDCEQLITVLHTAVERMQRQKEIATGEVKRNLVRTGEYICSDEVLRVPGIRKKYVLQELRDEKRDVFGYQVVTLCNGEADCPINCVIELDGKRYNPIWSFWLNSAYYNIKSEV